MRYRIIKKLPRFCQCLIYTAAMRTLTAVWKRRGFENRASLNMSSGSPERRLAVDAAEKRTASAMDRLGKVLGSLPSKGSDTISAIEEFASNRKETIEFRSKDRAPELPSAPHSHRRTKLSGSKGLENLKVTLNLARGDLEASILAS
ncbi:MAG TPA: hypothetical protein DDW94_01540 [Deltaproteobacteria bacterium]|nr:MAG: hypothetical protein A2Z79_07850 [Deltaproteobacteria bacterium GWA2_55_82]OGQ65142.1 MAG: hypothetical protein A3I81_07270 [Deltaproteobacteria bacterium RIFCSPLOWO2_02_FULL_55_12]OIJ74732.1 MAG: hypothetical protein A2V21_310940 [Deltaproteobacteria bacterium GWC2_55_46]HBG45656.1 hypothetical protein [Deltaproteobacteria bacterium]HCY12151.1 hypothetical protein [Deltaproteobacteria bacterium]